MFYEAGSQPFSTWTSLDSSPWLLFALTGWKNIGSEIEDPGHRHHCTQQGSLGCPHLLLTLLIMQIPCPRLFLLCVSVSVLLAQMSQSISQPALVAFTVWPLH